MGVEFVSPMRTVPDQDDLGVACVCVAWELRVRTVGTSTEEHVPIALVIGSYEDEAQERRCAWAAKSSFSLIDSVTILRVADWNGLRHGSQRRASERRCREMQLEGVCADACDIYAQACGGLGGARCGG